jgi:hypothetical protein
VGVCRGRGGGGEGACYIRGRVGVCVRSLNLTVRACAPCVCVWSKGRIMAGDMLCYIGREPDRMTRTEGLDLDETLTAVSMFAGTGASDITLVCVCVCVFWRGRTVGSHTRAGVGRSGGCVESD